MKTNVLIFLVFCLSTFVNNSAKEGKLCITSDGCSKYERCYEFSDWTIGGRCKSIFKGCLII